MILKITYIFLISILIVCLVPAENFGYDYLAGDLNTPIIVNYTTVNINNSDYLDGYDSSEFVLYTGAIGNVDLGANNFSTIGSVIASGFFSSDWGSQFGNASQYWEIEPLDLSAIGLGIHPMLNPYSDNLNIGVIGNGLLLHDVDDNGAIPLYFISNDLGVEPVAGIIYTTATSTMSISPYPFSHLDLVEIPSSNFSVDTDTLYVNKDLDRVGIGTANPSKRLHVVTDNLVAMILERNSAADISLNFKNTVNDWTIGYDNSADNFVIAEDEDLNDLSKQRLVISDTTGNIGIGTTTPTHKLNVVGDANITGDLFVNGLNITGGSGYVPYTGATQNVDLNGFNLTTGDLNVTRGSDIYTDIVGLKVNNINDNYHWSKAGVEFYVNDTLKMSMHTDLGSASINANTSYLYINGENYIEMRYNHSQGNYGGLIFRNYLTDVMALMGENVGINTLSPSHKLNVVGSANITENITIGGNFIGDGTYLTGIPIYNSSYVPYTGANKNVDLGIFNFTTNYLFVNNRGGIDNSNPAVNFHVGNSAKTSHTYIAVESASNKNKGYRWYGGGILEWMFYDMKDTSDLNLHSYSLGKSLLFFQNSTGFVGINTITPSHQFNVVGDANITRDLIVENDLDVVGLTTLGITRTSIFGDVSNFTSAEFSNSWSNVYVDLATDDSSALFYRGLDAGKVVMGDISGNYFNKMLYVLGNVLFDGNANITGNMIVGGNVTSENVFLPAYIRIPSNSTISVSGASVWTNITMSKKVSDLQFNIGHTWDDSTNETVTINDAGFYQIDYTVSIRDSAPNPSAHVGFRLYSTTNDKIVEGSYKEIDTSRQNEDLFKDASFLTEFSAGETFKLQFISDETTISVSPHGTWQPSPSSAQISIHKVANS